MNIIGINNKKIFLADIYRAINSQGKVVSAGDAYCGNIFFEEKEVRKDVVCISVGNAYVPLFFIDTYTDYLDVISHKTISGGISHPDQRFFGGTPNLRGFFIKNARPLFDKAGITKLEQLKEISQKTNPRPLFAYYSSLATDRPDYSVERE